jgi:16S rRNA (adenine1518-N6/adenine1519-N6)-dimethyltransferase
LVPDDQLDIFFRLAKAGFSQKRKKLRNSLSAGLNISKKAVEDLLDEVDIDANRRAETLNLQDWIRLTADYIQTSPPKS